MESPFSSGPRSLVRTAEEDGEPLVLLHPFSLCADVWQSILPSLNRHHPVFPLGIPGHMGAAPLPEDFDHTIEAAVDLLEVMLDHLGIGQAHLVGNSLGGWLALELSRRGRALSVVALAPGGGWVPLSPEHRRLMRKFKLTHSLLQIGGSIGSVLARFALARKVFLGDALAHPEQLCPEEAALLIDAARSCASFRGILDVLPTQPLAAPFETLPCPIRMVWGTEDRVLPFLGCSEHWRNVLQDADWLLLEGVGHLQMYDAPEAVVHAILSWTQRHYQRASKRPSVPVHAPTRLAG